MSSNKLPIIHLERPVVEVDGYLQTSRHTTDDGRFLVVWPQFKNFPLSIDLIDLTRARKRKMSLRSLQTLSAAITFSAHLSRKQKQMNCRNTRS